MTDEVLNLEEVRLADFALQETKTVSTFVERQFPSIYREEGRELVELVKSYYQFLETEENQSIYNIRRIYSFRNIDTTLEKMLIFFKNKFLNGLFLEEDTRFIVKNILDLYRRKGSKEGIELFFKLFFESEVSVYYPSEDMFKPSASRWKVGSFIQLYGTDNTLNFRNVVNSRIFGDKSKASAFVDGIYFINVSKTIVPILFLSDVKGQFSGFDVIFSRNPDITYGRVYGSMRTVTIDGIGQSSGNNQIGDVVEIKSSTGYGAKGRVTKVSQQLTGEIDFQIRSGGYGYTIANTDIVLSTQTLFFADPDPEIESQSVTFILGERLEQINSSNTVVIGTVIGQNVQSVGVRLDLTTSDAISTPNTYFFEGDYTIETLDRAENIFIDPIFVTEPNDTAAASIGTIGDTETITIVTDLIENYLDVPIDSADYSQIPPALLEMSGTRVNEVVPTANTPLNEAFVPETFVLGSITSLVDIDPGVDYFSDTFVLARENLIGRFNLTDQILRIVPAPGVVLFVGDTVLQTKTIQNFEGVDVEVEARGEVVKVEGNNIYVTHLSFESFVLEEPLFKQGSAVPITIVARSRDTSSQPIGLNAKIDGIVQTVVGKIQEVEIVDSGFAYEDGSTVELYNTSKAQRANTSLDTPDSFGIANARGQGLTEGKWVSFFSHINQEKVIQDSMFYQDYSYEITTDIAPDVYESEYRDLLHPAGMKLFTNFGKSDTINTDISISQPSIVLIESDAIQPFISDPGVIVYMNGFQYIDANTQLIEV